MSMKMRIGVAVFGLFIAIAVLFGIFFYMTYSRVDMSAINHIAEAQTGKYEFRDLAGDINAASIDDIGYVVKGDYNIDIYYGSQIIGMNRNCFKSQEFRDGLGTIGIKVYTHADEDGRNVQYKVTCWDEDVTQLSRVE